CLPLEKLHRDESISIVLVDLVNGADVGMVQGRSGLRLPLEAAERLRVFCDIIGKELQRHKAFQLGVLGLVDDTHPTSAEFLDNPVVGNGLAEHACGRSAAQLSYECKSSLRKQTL